jgi:TPP-dependent pyruvate/acetoin dehydrogenase alpha subunit
MPTRETNEAAKMPVRDLGLSDEIMMGLYRDILTARTLDERLRKLFRQGRYAGTYFSAVGQEACDVGPAYGLRDEDIIAPSHRDIGASVAKGVPIREIVAQVYARSNSPDKGKSHPCHYGSRPKGVISPASTVASQTIVGTGCAMAFKIQKKDNVVIALFGEGATSRGGWHEALNYAGSEAVKKARSGGGATFIECLTYRWYGHSEIDPADYRRKEELEYWKQRDPIVNAEKALMEIGLLTADKRESMIEIINQEIDEAVNESENAKYSDPEEAYLDVYSEDYPIIREEI